MLANSDSELLSRNLLFAVAKRDRAEDQSREQREIICGMEPLEPSATPRGIEVITSPRVGY